MRSWQEVSEVKVIQEEVSASTWGKKKQAESSSLLQGVPLHSPPRGRAVPPLSLQGCPAPHLARSHPYCFLLSFLAGTMGAISSSSSSDMSSSSSSSKEMSSLCAGTHKELCYPLWGGSLALAPPQPLPSLEPLLIWCQPARCTGPEPAARRKVTGGCSLKLSRLSCEEMEPS